MLHGHGTLSGVINKAIMVEFSCEQGSLSSAANEVSIEEGEVPCEASTPFGIVDEVSTEKGEAIPPLGSKATGNGKGSGKIRWCVEPIEDL